MNASPSSYAYTEKAQLFRQCPTVLRFRRRLTFFLVSRRCCVTLVFALFGLGTGLLIVRMLGVASILTLSAGMAATALATLISAVLELRKLPSVETTAAYLDAWNDNGGLLVARFEGVNPGEWAQSTVSLQMPIIRWRAGRTVTGLAGAVLYVLAVLFVPTRYTPVFGHRSLDLGETVEQMRNTIELVREEEIVSATQADDLQAELARVQSEASGLNPARSWAALDHMEEGLEQAAREHAEAALATLTTAEPTEALSTMLTNDGEALDDDVTAAAQRELAAMLGEADKMGTLGEKLDLPPGLLDKLERGAKLSREDLDRLAKALKKCRGKLSQKIARLCKARLVPASWLERCRKCNRGNGDRALLAYLDAHNPELAECLIAAGCCNSCNGGISRGRGDAEMTWSEGTSEDGARYKEEALPPASLDALRKSRLLGVSRHAPQAGTGQKPSAGGALNAGRPAAGGGRTRQVLPRHRRAVARFFDRANPARD